MPLTTMADLAKMAKPAGSPTVVFETRYYSVVERALVGAYNVPRKALGAFRGRLGHLQRHGLFGARHMPGKGKALAYGPDQFHRLVFACEAFEFGLSRAVVIALVKSRWERRLRKIFQDAERAAMIKPDPDNPEKIGGDIILYMGGVRLMTDTWSSAVPNINSCELRTLPDHMAAWMRMTPDDPAGLPPRALVTNLSMRLRAFHTALADAHDLTEPVYSVAPNMPIAAPRRAKREAR
jgi:hypothetical protein